MWKLMAIDKRRRRRRKADRWVGQLSMEVLGNASNSKRYHKPRCRPVGHRMLSEVVKNRFFLLEWKSCLRLPRNCSGAMYGSLPHNPVDMCMVFSQGKR